ncbi:MAG: hypothetical protein JJV89_04525 [Desulfosarcina sp.]|nr:hypothetical protein [Desulfobacterales bacterium]
MRIKLETKAKLFVQKKILLGKLQLIWSHILEYAESVHRKKECDNRSGVTAFSVNLSESIFPHLLSGSTGIFIGLSLSYLLNLFIKKRRPKNNPTGKGKKESCP